MIPVKDMRDMLQDRNLKEVARRSGISWATLYRIKTGSDPRASIAEKLSKYLEGGEAEDKKTA
jgi:predicted transcriptional regulator